MNRFYTTTICLFFFVVAAHAQNIGIGTTQPDASAALDISSSNKGLLIPRIDLAAAAPVTPATGLMVFNTNTAYSGGTGLYINMGTAATPQWMQLVPSTSGSFVRNQSDQQANSNFNVSGSGTIGSTLKVGSNSLSPLTVTSSHTNYTGILFNNSSSVYANWLMNTSGSASATPGSFSLINIATATTGLKISANGSVVIGSNAAPTATLDVYGTIKGADISAIGNVVATRKITAAGDITAGGNFIMDVKYLSKEYNIGAGSRNVNYLSCPAGYQVISGGGGHRDYNGAVFDIRIAYNGPDPSSPSTTWRVTSVNSALSSRKMVMYCNCAKVK
jgi:hypothetical protein